MSPRERRRIATRDRIARSAVDLALRVGSDGVTVEAICDAAAISVRSFYNYFDTKDGAIVGDGPVMPTRETLDRLRDGAGDDVFADLLDAVTESFAALDDPAPLARDRARLMRVEPALLEAMGNQMVKARDDLRAAVLARLQRRGGASASADALDLEAHAIIELKSAVMRTALQAWSSSETGSFVDARRAAEGAARTAMRFGASR